MIAWSHGRHSIVSEDFCHAEPYLNHTCYTLSFLLHLRSYRSGTVPRSRSIPINTPGERNSSSIAMFSRSHSRLLRFLGDEAQTHRGLQGGGTDSHCSYSCNLERVAFLRHNVGSRVFIGCINAALRSLLILRKERHKTTHYDSSGGTSLGSRETDPKTPPKTRP